MSSPVTKQSPAGKSANFYALMNARCVPASKPVFKPVPKSVPVKPVIASKATVAGKSNKPNSPAKKPKPAAKASKSDKLEKLKMHHEWQEKQDTAKAAKAVAASQSNSDSGSDSESDSDDLPLVPRKTATPAATPAKGAKVAKVNPSIDEVGKLLKKMNIATPERMLDGLSKELVDDLLDLLSKADMNCPATREMTEAFGRTTRYFTFYGFPHDFSSVLHEFALLAAILLTPEGKSAMQAKMLADFMDACNHNRGVDRLHSIMKMKALLAQQEKSSPPALPGATLVPIDSPAPLPAIKSGSKRPRESPKKPAAKKSVAEETKRKYPGKAFTIPAKGPRLSEWWIRFVQGLNALGEDEDTHVSLMQSRTVYRNKDNEITTGSTKDRTYLVMCTPIDGEVCYFRSIGTKIHAQLRAPQGHGLFLDKWYALPDPVHLADGVVAFPGSVNSQSNPPVGSIGSPIFAAFRKYCNGPLEKRVEILDMMRALPAYLSTLTGRACAYPDDLTQAMEEANGLTQLPFSDMPVLPAFAAQAEGMEVDE